MPNKSSSKKSSKSSTVNSTRSPVVLYGAGKNAQKEFEYGSYANLNPVCFVDADREKQGALFMELPVLSLEQARKKYGDDFKIFLTADTPLKHRIIDYLLGKGISKNRLLNYEAPSKTDTHLSVNRTSGGLKLLTAPHVNNFSETGFTLLANGVYETIEGVQVLSTMISELEAAYLFYIAKNEYSGEGAIVDLGPFCGLSTYSLLRGVSANPKIGICKEPCVYSFDLFLRRGYEAYITDSMLYANPNLQIGSVFMSYLDVVKMHLEHLHIVPGDLNYTSWSNLDIEILFIDVCKTWETNNHVTKTFFPHLIPGKSLVIHQDYIFCGTPWIHITMELLKEYFDVEGALLYNSMVYRCIKPLPESIREFDLLSSYSEQELINIHKKTITNASEDLKGIMKLSHAYFLYSLGYEPESKAYYLSANEWLDKLIKINPTNPLHQTLKSSIELYNKHVKYQD